MSKLRTIIPAFLLLFPVTLPNILPGALVGAGLFKVYKFYYTVNIIQEAFKGAEKDGVTPTSPPDDARTRARGWYYETHNSGDAVTGHLLRLLFLLFCLVMPLAFGVFLHIVAVATIAHLLSPYRPFLERHYAPQDVVSISNLLENARGLVTILGYIVGVALVLRLSM